jgi:hypothetical protein
MPVGALLLAAIVSIATTSAVAAQRVDWNAVDQAMGRQGSTDAAGVHKYSMPRSDLHVTVQGVSVEPALALGSWLAMEPRPGGGVIAMGDLVLTESEVNPTMLKLQQSGVMQTALHNHLLFDTPRVMSMHVHGEGAPVEIARAVRAALATTATPMGAGAAGDAATSIDLDTAAIARALGHHGSVSGGVYKLSIPRAETIRSDGVEVPPSMGTAIGIGFQPTGGGKAAITGDFVLLPAEVNPVIEALRENGILVTAIHQHMLFDEPHLIFMHFWANDDAVKLAHGLRAALDHVAAGSGR